MAIKPTSRPDEPSRIHAIGGRSALLSIVLAGSSPYLVLKVGMTVSASIPMQCSLSPCSGHFRRLRSAASDDPENNIVQTAGSAGESTPSSATMPRSLLGFDIDLTRVMVYQCRGFWHPGNDPLRRAFIVKIPDGPGNRHAVSSRRHGCAQVLISRERRDRQTIFIGFGLAFFHVQRGHEPVDFDDEAPAHVRQRAAVFAGEMARAARRRLHHRTRPVRS